MKKILLFALSFLLAAGCGGKSESQAQPEAAQAPEADAAAEKVTTYTETIGDVSFEMTSLWTKEVKDGMYHYYRYFDDQKHYEAFILADAVPADYDQYSSVTAAHEHGAKESLPDGAKVVFANGIEIDGTEGYQIEFEGDYGSGAQVCDMMLIGGKNYVTRMYFTQNKEGDVDYGYEFEDIWATVKVNEGVGFNEAHVSYEQSDYLLNCYEQNDGTVACDAMLEIANTGDVPLWLNNDVTFDVYNESGSVIASVSGGSIDLIPEVILPGEYGYYMTTKPIELPGGYFAGSNYELGGEYNPVAVSFTPHDYPVEIASVVDDDGRPSALGYVTNDTAHTYPNIQLYVVYYDNEEYAVGAAHDYIGKLEPGTKQPFSLGGSLTLPSASIAVVSSYNVIAREAYSGSN